MRQMCPYCGKLVELADNAAGRETPCPACGKAFAIPKAYAPSVGTPAVDLPPIVTTASQAEPGDDKAWGLAVSATFADWLPVVSLTVALISVLFFSWVGAYPGGYRAFTQSPLQALFASFDKNQMAILGEAEKDLEVAIKSNWLMLPFLLGLIAATALAWLERIFPNPTLTTVPAILGWLVKFHPRRHLMLTALSGLCLALMLGQCWRGFGLQNAVKTVAAAKFAKEDEAADNSAKKQEVPIKIGQEIGKFCLADTLASDVGMTALVLALEGFLFRWWLDRRGKTTPPRLVWQY